MPQTNDPLSELIAAVAKLEVKPAAGSALDEAADLIPGRTETEVEDMLESPALARFRMHYAAGQVEAELIVQVVGILKGLLVARGLL